MSAAKKRTRPLTQSTSRRTQSPSKLEESLAVSSHALGVRDHTSSAVSKEITIGTLPNRKKPRTPSPSPTKSCSPSSAKYAVKCSTSSPDEEPPPTRKPQASIEHVSKIKLLAMKQCRKTSHRTLRKDSSKANIYRTDNGEAVADGDEENEEPHSASVSPASLHESPAPEVDAPPERCQLATIETKDSQWSAMIEGDLAKFMYPSLRLEALYDTSQPNHRPPANGVSLSPIPVTRQPFQLSDAKVVSTPSLEQIEDLMAITTRVDWAHEKRFMIATQSVPTNGHPRMDELEYKRTQFDKQLEIAEGLLRKKDAALLDAKREKGVLLTRAHVIGKQPHGKHDLDSNHRVSFLNDTEDGESGTDVLAAVRGRPRGASLYEPSVLKNPHAIPRLPHTRKIIKQIQRHTTNHGQIEYYADKQNLFAKWKKLQLSELHKRVPPQGDGDNSDALEDDNDDSDTQQLEALSPRSLFYHECVKKDILPEPIFSRINDVKLKRPALPPRKTPKRQSFTQVAATLIQSVHERHTTHDDIVTTADGQFARKKHHLALHLQHFGLGDRKLDALSKSLQHFQSIHVLDLSDNRLTDESIIKLLECLEAASTLRPVALGSARTRLGNDLRMLNLSQNEIGVAGCEQIARFLGICTCLTHLDLSHAKIGDVNAMGPLTRAIEEHRTLHVLNLSYNDIGPKCAVLVGDMLTQPTCEVKELDISWNQICHAGAMAIGRALRTNTNLTKLCLAMNRFSDDGGEQIAAALASNTSLVELDLSRNNLGGRSAVAFGFFLRTNQTLLHLRLQDNRLGANGAKALLRAVALGSPCEFVLSAHDVESLSGQKEEIFDVMVPGALSPFTLHIGDSPYDLAVASELIDTATVHQSSTLTDITFTDTRDPKEPVSYPLLVDTERGCLVHANNPSSVWSTSPWPDYGILSATATFAPPPVKVTPDLDKLACVSLIRIIERGFSSREIGIMLALAVNDLFLTTDLASIFITHLRHSLDVVDIVGRLWPCLVDGERVFDFLQTNLSASEQRRLVDAFGAMTIQFTTSNPTGHWALDLGDRGQRKIALWFAMLNNAEAVRDADLHPKRTDSAQFGKGYHWRNVSYNRHAIRLNYSFFDRLPVSGILEFDYVSSHRHEDARQPVEELTDDALEALINRVGIEMCAVYIPLHKRKDLKYQLLFFHLAIADRYITSQHAHRVLQFFPKNYESCRFKIILAVHRSLVDLENLDEMLERLTLSDRRRVYHTLGYLNVVNPLAVDMDFEVDFERDDEKMLLRALVDLSMACPTDMIRIESERSTVLVIYSMYQSNTVPATGRIFFRYVSHPPTSRSEFLRTRQLIFRYFLCGERLRVWVENGAIPAASSIAPVSIPNSNALENFNLRALP